MLPFEVIFKLEKAWGEVEREKENRVAEQETRMRQKISKVSGS